MEKSEKVLTYATSFALVSGGVLLLACVRPVLGISRVQAAQALNLTADASRMLSLAKTYDAKAAVESLKLLKDAMV